VTHRAGVYEYLVQFGIVLVGAAAEARADLGVPAVVELPPRALEIEHRPLALGQFGRTRVWAVPRDLVWAVPRSDVHLDSLTREPPEVEDVPEYVRQP
jgi:hypothetical protein